MTRRSKKVTKLTISNTSISSIDISNISLDEWKHTWMAKSGDSIFISALHKNNFDTFKDKLYEMAKEIHAKRFPYNSFLY